MANIRRKTLTLPLSGKTLVGTRTSYHVIGPLFEANRVTLITQQFNYQGDMWSYQPKDGSTDKTQPALGVLVNIAFPSSRIKGKFISPSYAGVRSPLVAQ